MSSSLSSSVADLPGLLCGYRRFRFAAVAVFCQPAGVVIGVLGQSRLTRALKCSPRWAYDEYQSKLAHPGERTTASPGPARRPAISTASSHRRGPPHGDQVAEGDGDLAAPPPRWPPRRARGAPPSARPKVKSFVAPAGDQHDRGEGGQARQYGGRGGGLGVVVPADAILLRHQFTRWGGGRVSAGRLPATVLVGAGGHGHGQGGGGIGQVMGEGRGRSVALSTKPSGPSTALGLTVQVPARRRSPPAPRRGRWPNG